MDIQILLIDFIKEHDQKTLKKGTDLFFKQPAAIELIEKEEDDYLLEVPSQTAGHSYEVSLWVNEAEADDEDDIDIISADCECEANQAYFECKHCIAATKGRKTTAASSPYTQHTCPSCRKLSAPRNCCVTRLQGK